jgi:hypothetical protein
MYEQVTLQVSDHVVRQAVYVALKSQQRVEEVLARWLEKTAELLVDELPDDEVLALTDASDAQAGGQSERTQIGSAAAARRGLVQSKNRAEALLFNCCPAAAGRRYE